MEDNRVPEQAEAPKKKGKVKKTWQQEVWEWIKAIVMAVVIVVVLQSFLFSIIRVEGQSMETTLHDGERLFGRERRLVHDARLRGLVQRPLGRGRLRAGPA